MLKRIAQFEQMKRGSTDDAARRLIRIGSSLGIAYRICVRISYTSLKSDPTAFDLIETICPSLILLVLSSRPHFRLPSVQTRSL